MGWFDGVSDVGGDRHSHSHSQSHSRGKRHNSTPSLFGLGGSHHNSSRSSFFGGRTSSYKRSSRKGYLSKIYSQLRRLIRDLLYYLKRNPVKVFVLVIMPLITGGALSGLLSKFGIRLPAGLERMIAKMGGGGGFGESGIGRGPGGGLQFERKRYEGPLGSMGSMGGAGSLLNVAKMFM